MGAEAAGLSVLQNGSSVEHLWTFCSLGIIHLI